MRFFKKSKTKLSEMAASEGTPPLASPTRKKKKNKSLRKMILSFSKKGATNRSRQERNQSTKFEVSNSISITPEVGGEVTKFYSNNTEGFEVILDGRRLNFAENRAAPEPGQELIRRPNHQDWDLGCSPILLSDWKSFAALLTSPNHLSTCVFGDDNEVTNEKSRGIAPPVTEIFAYGCPSDQETCLTVEDDSYNGKSGHRVGESPYSSPLRVAPIPEGEPVSVEIQHFISIPHSADHATSPQLRLHSKTPSAVSTPLSNPRYSTGLNSSAHSSPSSVRTPPNGQPSPFRVVSPPRPTRCATLYKPKPDIPDEETYDTEFTLKFLKEISNMNIAPILTYFKVPTGDDEDDEEITSITVNLTIKPGLSRGSRLLEPKLCWKDIHAENGVDTEGTSVSLLGIHSIHTSINANNEDDAPFFTITTEEGEVHAFESPTLSERNYVVHGIKNVVAWLSFHLVMGNMAMGTQMADLDEDIGPDGELPSLKTPIQAMNDLSHVFLR